MPGIKTSPIHRLRSKLFVWEEYRTADQKSSEVTSEGLMARKALDTH